MTHDGWEAVGAGLSLPTLYAAHVWGVSVLEWSDEALEFPSFLPLPLCVKFLRAQSIFVRGRH